METSRPEPSAHFVNLQLNSKIFPAVMDTLRDPSLSDKERVYLSYLTGVCGTHGCTFRLQKTIGAELHKGDYTIRRIEKSLHEKGRLCIFEHCGRIYRSPYPDLVDQFLASQEPTEAPVEATEQSCQALPDKTVTQPPRLEPINPAPKAVEPTCPQAPIRQYNPERVKQPVQAELSTSKSYQTHTHEAVDNSTDWFKQPKTDTKNPFNKNRYIVKHMTDDICETLGIWQSWKWVAKQIWSISEEAEQYLIHSAKWVKEEVHCNRCTNPFGLLRWKMVQEGLLACP